MEKAFCTGVKEIKVFGNTLWRARRDIFSNGVFSLTGSLFWSQQGAVSCFCTFLDYFT